jgi:hypothetical protein
MRSASRQTDRIAPVTVARIFMPARRISKAARALTLWGPETGSRNRWFSGDQARTNSDGYMTTLCAGTT